MGTAVFLLPFYWVFRDGFHTILHGGFPISCSLAECIRDSGGGDQHWYLLAGQWMERGPWLNAETAGIYALWPPGQAALNAGIIYLFGDGVRIGIILGCIVAAGWGAVASIPVFRARTPWQIPCVGIIGGAFVSAPFMTTWPLGVGVLYADGLGSLFLLLGVLVLGFAPPPRLASPLLTPTVAGVLLAISAYFRSTNEFIVNVLTIVVCIALVVSTIIALVKRTTRSAHGARIGTTKPWSVLFVGQSVWVMKLVVAIVCAQAIMIPWRVVVHERVTGEWAYTVASRGLWAGNWNPIDSVAPGQEFIYAWAPNGMCLSYPVRCREIASVEQLSGAPYSGLGAYTEADFRDFALQAFFSNPLPWFQSRGTLVKDNWGSPHHLDSRNPRQPTGSILTSWFSFGMVLLVLASLIQCTRRSRRYDDYALPFTLFVIVAVTVGIPMVSHFEPRYFLPAQVVGIIGAYCIVWPARRTRGITRRYAPGKQLIANKQKRK